MELELKHLAPYLPYGLKVTFEADEYQHEVIGLSICSRGIEVISPFLDFGQANIKDVIPILRPLSDLWKGDLEHLTDHHSTDYFSDNKGLKDLITQSLNNSNLHHYIEFLPFGLVQWLIENHYDIYNLIEKGLAIDMNTLNK